MLFRFLLALALLLGGVLPAVAQRSDGPSGGPVPVLGLIPRLNLSDVPNKNAARANLGLGNSATLNVGNVTGTVAAGDDARIVGALQSYLLGQPNGVAQLNAQGQVPGSAFGVITPSLSALAGNIDGIAGRTANVVDVCGAVPDGATDSYAGLQACLNAGYWLRFPEVPGQGATATASLSGSSLSPTVPVTSGGARYYSAPQAQFVGGQGSGASVIAFVNAAGTIDTTQGTGPGGGYTITSGGSGYVASDASGSTYGGCGTAPTFTPNFTGGVLTSITWLTLGSNCPIPPNLLISPGTVALGTATTANGVVTGITLTNVPSGYSSPPIVQITSGPTLYYVSTGLLIRPGQEIFGEGMNNVVLRRALGTGTPVIGCANTDALNSTGTYDQTSGASTSEWYVHDISLDGSAGTFPNWNGGSVSATAIFDEAGVSCYGMHERLERVRAQNIEGRGFQLGFRRAGTGGGSSNLGHAFIEDVQAISTGLEGIYLAVHDSEIHDSTATNNCRYDQNRGAIYLSSSVRASFLHPASTTTTPRCLYGIDLSAGGAILSNLSIEGGQFPAIIGASTIIGDSTFFAAAPQTAGVGRGLVQIVGSNVNLNNVSFSNSSGAQLTCVQLGSPLTNVSHTIITNGVFKTCGLLGPVDTTYDIGNSNIQANGTALDGSNPAWSSWVSGGTVTFVPGQPGVLNSNPATVASQTVSFPSAAASVAAGSPSAEIATVGAVSAVTCVPTGTDLITGCPTSLAANQVTGPCTPTLSGSVYTWACGAVVTVPFVGPPRPPQSDTWQEWITTINQELRQIGSVFGAPQDVESPLALGSYAWTTPASGATYAPGNSSNGGVIASQVNPIATYTVDWPQCVADFQLWGQGSAYGTGGVTAWTSVPYSGDTIVGAAAGYAPGAQQEFQCHAAAHAWEPRWTSTTNPVTSFNARTGAVSLLSADVTTALGYTPLSLGGGTLTGALHLGSNTLDGSAIAFTGGTLSGLSSLGVTGSTVLAGSVSGAGFVSAAAAAAPVQSVAGRTGAVTLGVADVSGAAPLASPTLTGSPTAPTQATGDNSTLLATDAWVKLQGYLTGITSGQVTTALGYTPLNQAGGTMSGALHLGANIVDGSAIAFTGGTLNGVTIGGTTAAAGTFSALTVNGAATISGNSLTLSPSHTSITGSTTTGTWSGLYQNTTYTGTNTSTGGIIYNLLQMTDQVAVTSGNGSYGLEVAELVGGSAATKTNSAQAIDGIVNVNGAVASGGSYTALTGQAKGSVNVGGVNGTTIGQLFGFNPVAHLFSGATYWNGLSGGEIDVSVDTGATGLYDKIGLHITELTTDAVAGSRDDIGLCLCGQGGATEVGWTNVYTVGRLGANPPVNSGSTIFALIAPQGGSFGTVTNGFNLSAATFTGNTWNDGHVVLTGSGEAQLNSTTALSLSATAGFVDLPTTAGIPTGTPGVTALSHCAIDTTNNYLNCYYGGAWHKAAFAAGAG